ncbi:FMN-binding protein [Conyzicola sp.]|uniref:FMN-binding protein n=1 Tax=Conyzicola sp. TaxID=1969404 RepID=UPI00398A5056
MNTQRAKYPFAILTGLTLVGALAGCSTAADGDTTTDSGTGTTESTTAPDTADGATTTGSYTDGEYTESAEYQSPNGTEEVTVTVTLADGVITAVESVGDGDNPNSKRYQTEFADGIADVVVGKNIDDISVDKVAGSSLTSDGFNAAIEKIKADAAS